MNEPEPNPEPDYTVLTDYMTTCTSCGEHLCTTQHNNQFCFEETVTCECGKTTLVKWSN